MKINCLYYKQSIAIGGNFLRFLNLNIKKPLNYIKRTFTKLYKTNNETSKQTVSVVVLTDACILNHKFYFKF
jgi:hypothetical protein